MRGLQRDRVEYSVTNHHHLETETAQLIDRLGLVLGEGGSSYRVDYDFPFHGKSPHPKSTPQNTIH
ncbi:hypothetical protein, partial [Rhizobium johnstonii]|uniref:hypothetical protein n=1 Tax=Rhizobium johnstonii TaxID=3019933 RepID=UPI003F98AD90